MGYTKEQRIINAVSGSTRQQRETQPTNLTGTYDLPNNSGDHRKSIKRDTPTQSYDLVNKEYVDAGDLWTRTGTTLQPKTAGDDITTTGLGTFGNLDVDTLNLNGNVISDSTGTISFSNENLTTTGTVTATSTNKHTVGEWEFTSANFEGVMTNTGQNYQGRINFADDGLNALFSTDFGNWNNQGGYEGVKIGHFYNEDPDNMDVMLTLSYAGNIDVSSGYDLRLLGDNDKIILGAGKNAGFRYDGTNLIINPKEVGSGYVDLKGDVVPEGDLYFQDSGAGLPFGEIYVEANTTATTISVQNTWYQFTGFDTNGLSNLTTPDHTQDHITISKAGVYKIDFNASFTGGTGKTYEIAIQKNNGATVLTNIHVERKLGSTDIGVVSASGFCSCSANDTIELWIRCTDVTTANATLRDVNLNLIQIGG